MAVDKPDYRRAKVPTGRKALPSAHALTVRVEDLRRGSSVVHDIRSRTDQPLVQGVTHWPLGPGAPWWGANIAFLRGKS